MQNLQGMLILFVLTFGFLGQVQAQAQAQAYDQDRDREGSQSANAQRVIVQGPVKVVVPQNNIQPNVQPAAQKYWIRHPEPARKPSPARQPEPAGQPSMAGQPAPSPNKHSHQNGGHNKDHDRDNDRGRFHHPFIIYAPPVVSYVNVVPNGTILQDVGQEYTQPAADAGYMPVFINGALYFYDSTNAAFYQKTFAGYGQVDPVSSLQGTVTIGIPNNSGGYTQIQLEVVPNGYIGPQGELYPQFPSIAQLRAMYVR